MSLIERGSEPTMRAVAAAAGASERTIYRYFESHDVLIAALKPMFIGKTGVDLCSTFNELPDYAAALFGTFEDNRHLVIALVTSSWAAPHLRRSRSGNLKALRALVDTAFPAVTEGDRAAATSAIRVILSGAGWNYLRHDCGLSAIDVVAHARWSIAAIAQRLAGSASVPDEAPPSS